MSQCIQGSRRPILVLAVLAAIAFSFVAGLAEDATDSGRVGQSHSHYYEEMANVPEKARDRANPLETDPHAPAAGRKLFAQHCSECHGNSAEGGRRGPSLRATQVRTATPGTLFWVLTNGVVRRGMPVWSKLPEPQRWQIVSYLKSLN